MGLGDPEARQLETTDYPALMAFPNAKYSNTFFKASRRSPFISQGLFSQTLNLRNCDVVQVLDSLYAAYGYVLSQYTISIDNQVVKQELKPESVDRCFAGMVAFTLEREVDDPTVPQGKKTVNITNIFRLGGYDEDAEKVIDSVACYSIDDDEWQMDIPALKVKRCMNSTCQQGNFIYTFAGASTVDGDDEDGYRPT